jgi:hypothetical protein
MQQQLLGMANSAQQSQQMLDQMTALATTVSTLQTQLDKKNSLVAATTELQQRSSWTQRRSWRPRWS